MPIRKDETAEVEKVAEKPAPTPRQRAKKDFQKPVASADDVDEDDSEPTTVVVNTAKPGQKLETKKPTVVQKNPLEEAFKKYLNTIDATFVGKINDISVRVVNHEAGKMECVFAMFSANGAADEDIALDDKTNVAVIKDVLFKYMTIPEKVQTTGKVPVFEVLSPEKGTDNPHILVFHEEAI